MAIAWGERVEGCEYGVIESKPPQTHSKLTLLYYHATFNCPTYPPTTNRYILQVTVAWCWRR